MGYDDQPITILLQRWAQGDQESLERLMPILYDELRRLAGVYMRRERAGHTLSPTDLVGEAFVRLSAGEKPDYESRVQFFAIAARQMRRVLVDHARRRLADKREARRSAISFDETLHSTDRPEALVALDEALDALAAVNERKARALDMRYFGGMELKEIAQALGVHENTVAKDLRLAETWVHQYMTDPCAP